jgi:hypothetical protein
MFRGLMSVNRAICIWVEKTRLLGGVVEFPTSNQERDVLFESLQPMDYAI